MASIHWATGTSGTWTTASDWSGDMVPGSSDSATISASASAPYTVLVNSKVTVGSVLLDQEKAMLEIASGTFSVLGTLALDAGTISVGPGNATIKGGTYASAAGNILISPNNCTLTALRLDGNWSFNGLSPQSTGVLYVSDLSFAGADGSGAGTLGMSNVFVVDASTSDTLSNVALTLGDNALYFSNVSTFTLASSASIEATGTDVSGAAYHSDNLFSYNGITNDGAIGADGGTLEVDTFYNQTANTLTNAGKLSASNDGTLIAFSVLDNSGLVSVTSGGVLTIQAGFINTGSVVLSGGTLELDYALTTGQLGTLTNTPGFNVTSGTIALASTLDNSGATLEIGGAAIPSLSLWGGSIVGGTIAAETPLTFGNNAGGGLSGVTLNGSLSIGSGEAVQGNGTLTLSGGSSFLNSGSFTLHVDSTLTAINSTVDNAKGAFILDAGTIALSNSASFANLGTMTLKGGSLITTDGTVENGAVIHGTGTISAAIGNYGYIAANGGTLTLTEGVGGVGMLKADTNSTLNVAAVGAGQIVDFAGTGAMLSLAPLSFLGSIAHFASGDTIDLQNTAAKSASLSGDSLVVTLSAGTTLALRTSEALTGSLAVTAGTHGDSLISFAGAAENPASLHQPEAAPLTGWLAFTVGH